MRVHTRNLLAILAFVFFLVPILAQPYYSMGTDTLYLDRHIDTLSEVDTGTVYWYNTTGEKISIAITETLPENDTWYSPLVLANQDTDLGVWVYPKIEAASIWNYTAWDSDTTGHIIAFDYRITIGDDTGEALQVSIGFSGDPDLFVTQRTYLTSNSYTRVTLTQAQYDMIDDGALAFADDAVQISIWEDDANHLINGAEVRLSMRFYSANNYVEFDQVLMLLGLCFFAIGLGMTTVINVTRKSKRYSSWRFRQHLRYQAYRYRARQKFRRRRR